MGTGLEPRHPAWDADETERLWASIPGGSKTPILTDVEQSFVLGNQRLEVVEERWPIQWANLDVLLRELMLSQKRRKDENGIIAARPRFGVVDFRQKVGASFRYALPGGAASRLSRPNRMIAAQRRYGLRLLAQDGPAPIQRRAQYKD